MAKAFAMHPGEILLTEFMQPYGMTAYRLAKELCVAAPRMNDIVRGKRAISADTALRLGIYFGPPAQFWLNLQNDCDLRVAAKARALQKLKQRRSCLSTQADGRLPPQRAKFDRRGSRRLEWSTVQQVSSVSLQGFSSNSNKFLGFAYRFRGFTITSTHFFFAGRPFGAKSITKMGESVLSDVFQ